MLSKTQLRKNCIEKRKNLGHAYICNQSEIIISKVLNTHQYKKANSVFVYVSTQGEVSTNKLIRQAICDNKILLVPVLINSTEMAATVADNDTVFIKNKYNIDEPCEKNFYNDKIDIIITPGLCFDENGARLGYGGGFFDRFFAKNKEAFKSGLCLDEFIVSAIPSESHDIKMDMIITQSRIINI